MVQTRELRETTVADTVLGMRVTLLCAKCCQAFAPESVAAQELKELNESVDPEIKKLRDLLEAKGLM